MTLEHADLTHAIIGALFTVFNELGHGFSERIYLRAAAIVLRELGFEAVEECPVTVVFHGTVIGEHRLDIVVDGKVLIEIKAGQQLEPWHEAQILNYMKCAGGGVGLLVNFGQKLSFKRFVMGRPGANLPNIR